MAENAGHDSGPDGGTSGDGRTQVQRLAAYAHRAQFGDLSPESVRQLPVHVLDCLHALVTWVGEGTPPPRAARLELASQQPLMIARDQNGIALGGVRTPAVDVPVVTLSGQGPPGAAGPGWLVGSTTPLDDATLLRLHGDKSGYLSAYTRSLDAAIRDGFLLLADRAELLAEATAFPFPAP